MPTALEQERVGQDPLEPKIDEPSELAKPEEQRLEDLGGALDRIERSPGVQPVVDDATSQVVLTPSGSQEPEIILPLTEAEVKIGLHQKVLSGARWVAEWCARAAMKALRAGVRVVYRR